MKLRSLILAFCILGLCASAAAQDLKPVKDKGTKLFGYQDKGKNWVIQPAFTQAKRFNDGFAIVEVDGLKGVIDETGAWVLRPEYDNIDKYNKVGLCEVTVKRGKTKYRGVANRAGELVVPAECHSVSIDKSEGLIMALKDVEVPRAGLKSLWGVYRIDGTELFEPQFLTSPSFYNGRGVAKSAFTGLKGVIDLDGNEILPFEHLAISSSFGGYEVLTADFVRRAYDSRIMKTSEFAYPGYVIPYDTMGDPVRAAAWHKWPVGFRFHRNNLREVQVTRDSRYGNASCATLRIDWGYDRFVRFEPVRDTLNHPGLMLCHETGDYYTLKAVLYERDGMPAGELASWGWIEGECEEGIIYNAEGRETWMLMRDLNCPAIPSFSTPLSGYRKVDNSDIQVALDISSYDIGRLYDPSRAADRYLEIIEGENLGISSRLPRPAPELRMAGVIDKVNRTPLFRRPFRMGQVVNCKTMHNGESIEVRLSDNLLCGIVDRFEDPSYDFKGEEELFWGPDNNYTVWLSLEPVHGGAPELIEDDVYNTGRRFELVLSLYDERDQYIRTIATVPAPDFFVEGVLVFEKAGIALITEHGGHGGRPDARPDSRPGSHHDRFGGRKISSSEPHLAPKLSVIQDIQPAGGRQPGRH